MEDKSCKMLRYVICALISDNLILSIYPVYLLFPCLGEYVFPH